MAEQIICRLCLEKGTNFIEIHSDIGDELKIKDIVSQHLCFDIRPDDQISNKVCVNCWDITNEFHKLYSKIHKAQERIAVIYNNQIVILHEKGNQEETVIDEVGTSVDIEIAENKELDVQDEEILYEFKVEPRDIHIEEKEAELDMREEIETDDDRTGEFVEIDIRKKENEEKNDELRSCRSSSKEMENSDGNSVADFNSDIDEYNPEIKLKNRGRKPIKKDLLEAEKEKEEKLIESYYKMNCEICHNNFERFEKLFEHYQSIHSIRGFIICCGKKFFRRSVIAEHIMWHTDPDLFKCHVCNKIYADKRCLNNHLLVHAPPDMKLFKCEHCPKSFVKKFKLEQHKLSHLSPEEKKYICDECQKPYASDALLRAHKRVVHEKTYAHMCEICAKVFKSRVFFEKHQLEHLGQNLPRVQCQICEAWMKNEHTMRAHMRLHQDAGIVHECDICGKQGPSRNAILKHKRFVHLSERKFKCTLCDKAFKRAITLKEHISVHTGEILYTCIFCPKTFNSGANMHAHKKKAHPVEWEEEKRAKQLSLKPENCIFDERPKKGTDSGS